MPLTSQRFKWQCRSSFDLLVNYFLVGLPPLNGMLEVEMHLVEGASWNACQCSHQAPFRTC